MPIQLNTALAKMNNSDIRKEPFSIEFITCDRVRKTGGKLMKLRNMVSSGANHNEIAHGTITIKSAFGDGHPIPVHIRLITKFNEEFVV